MKKVMIDFKMYSLYLGMFLLTLGLNSCSDDDDAGVIEQPDQPTATLNVEDQTISQNRLVVENITVGQDSWLVVRNAGSENEPNIVSDPVLIEEGTHENVEIPLDENANLTGNPEGDDLVVMVHSDDPDAGVQGEYDFNGQNNADAPITDSTGAVVRGDVNVTAPSLQADDDQMVTEEGDVTFSSVNTGATGGYIGLYAQNEDGTPNYDEMVGTSEYIAPGAQTDVTARFTEGYGYEAGQTYYPRLYTDNPNDQQFTYTQSGGTEDLPETYGYNTTTGAGQYVGNTANTTTPGGFTVGNTGTGTGPGVGTGTGGGM